MGARAESVQAAACGAVGCSENGPLYRVRHPSKGVRVVCEAHARRVLGLKDAPESVDGPGSILPLSGGQG